MSDTRVDGSAPSAPLVSIDSSTDVVRIVWAGRADAGGYEVELHSPRGVHASWRAGAQERELSLPAMLLPPRSAAYAVRVRAVGKGAPGTWSAPQQVVAAEQTKPDGGTPDDARGANTLLPAPLLQVTYQAGAVVLDYTPVSGATSYTGQILSGSTIVATQSSAAQSMSFSASQYGLAAGTTYTVRVAATAGGANGSWSFAQSVTIVNLDAPAPVTTFAGGTLYGNVQSAVANAQFYAFQAWSDAGGTNELLAEAFAAPDALPAAFEGSFTDGQTYTVRAQAVEGNALSAWSAFTPITVQVLTPPLLTLTYTAPNLNASWPQVAALTQYQFQLWTAGASPQLVDDQTLTAAPYSVQIGSGLVEDQIYQGQVRSQSGLNSSVWSTAQVQASVLDLRLQALYDSLNANWGGGATLTLDAATLTTPGAAIATLIQNNLGPGPLVLGGTIALTSDPVADTVTASGSANGPLLGVGQPTVTAVFSVSGTAIVANITVAVGPGYSLAATFPALQQTQAADLTWNDDTAASPAFVLSSLGAPATAPYGPLVAGLNFYGSLNLSGSAAALLALIPGVTNPLPLTGAIVGGAASDTFSFQLSTTVPPVSFSNLPNLSTLSFASPQFIVYGAGTRESAAHALWIGADVIAGGVTLPLVVQLPMGGASGWVILLRPGSAIPLPSLTSFFGFVTGTTIGSALPAAVTSQTGLQIVTFRLALLPTFDAFSSFSMTISSGTNASANPLWSPLPGVLDLTSLRLFIAVVPSGDSVSVSGSIGGTVLLGGTLQLGANLLLPIGTGNWTFTASSSTSLASLDAFNSTVGGSSFAALLPASLGALPQFTLGSLTLIVNPTGPTLVSTAIVFYSNSPWHIVGDQLVLDQLSIDLTIASPASSPLVTGTIQAQLVLGSVRISAIVANPTGSGWTLVVGSDAVPLPSLSDLANFVGGSGAAALLPSSLASASFTLTDVSVAADLSNSTLQSIGFTLGTSDTWVILGPDLLEAGEASVTLALDWTSGALITTGNIAGTVLVAGASFLLDATYAGAAWTISATMAPPSGTTGVLDFSSALTQLDLGSTFVVPSSVGLPALQLTGGSFVYVPSTGALSIAATSSLNWPIAFGSGTNPMQIASLGASVNRLANGAGWNASIDGALTYSGLSATASLVLGSAGTDTIITASVGNLSAANVPVLADNLAQDSSGTNSWSTIAFPSDFPSIGLAQAQLYLNLTNSTFVLTGSSSVFGTAAFVVQQQSNVWGAALGVNLSSDGQPWTFSQISAGLAAAGSFFNIDQASAAIAISNIDGQSLAPIARQVPELANALPATVRRGANFYGVLHFSSAVVANVPRILGTDAGTTVTLYALIAQSSADSYFEVDLDQYTLAGVVTFSGVVLKYQPATSPSLSLAGTVSIPIGASTLVFNGSMQVGATSARFAVQQTAQNIFQPFGMHGITISDVGATIDYTFPDAATSTLVVQVSGTTQIGSVANLTGVIYVVDGTPTIAAISVTDFNITNLFSQNIGVSWPAALVPVVFTSGAVYYSNAQGALTLGGVVYQPGFNVNAQLLLFGVPATLTFSVVPNQGVTATGLLNNPIDWGFIVIRGTTAQVGPSASLATYPTTTFTLVAGFAILGTDVGTVTFAIAKSTTADENVATMTFSKDVGAPFGTITLTISWSESQGLRFENFPLDFPANFEIPDINFPSGACVGKQILQSLPIDTTYNLDSSFSFTSGALVITFQGSFALTAMNQQVLTIQLQTLTATIPPPTGGSGALQWSDIPGWIATTIIDNAGAMLQQVLNDPASMAKLLAIEGVKYAASALVDALVCENAELWGASVAESFVAAAGSPFVSDMVIGGISVAVGGVGVATGAGGSTTVGGGGGGGSDPPPPPGTPGNLTLNYTGDVLYLGWSSASNAQTYAWLVQSGSATLATQPSTTATSATVQGSSSMWGGSYTLTVVANNQGVLGSRASASYQVPTPQSVASAQQSGGTAIAQAATVIRTIFPSVGVTAMGNALIAAYSAQDPSTNATAVATALRNGGFSQNESDAALPELSWSPAITSQQVASAIQVAYALDQNAFAQYLAQHGVGAVDAAQMLAGTFTLTAGQVISLLQANYSGLGAQTLVAALAASGYPMADTAAAVQAAVATPIAEMAAYLVASFAAQNPTPSAVALVLIGLSSGLTPLQLVQALLSGFSALTPVQAAQALVSAFTTPQPIDATTVAATLAAAFTALAPSDLAIALVAAFVSPAITPNDVAAALAALSPQPALDDVAIALVAAFTTPQPIAPAAAAAALVAAYTSAKTVALGGALVAAFTTPAPIDASAVAAALAAAQPTLTANELATALSQIFAGISQNDVAVALVAAVAGASLQQIGSALVAAFGTAATVSTIAVALTTAVPAATPGEVAQTLAGLFPTLTAADLAVTLVGAFAQPSPLAPSAVMTALLTAIPTLTATAAAQALVAAFVTPAAITPVEVVQQLVAVTFAPPLAPSDVAVALAAAWSGEGALDAAQVLAAMIAGYATAVPSPSLLGAAIVAAFSTTTASQLAQTLQSAPFDPLLAIGETAVAVAAAMPAVTAPELGAALLTAYAASSPTAAALAGAIVAALPSTTATTLAQLLVASFSTPTPITPAATAAAIVAAMTNAPVALDALVTALQTAFTSTPLTLAAAAAAIEQAYAGTNPVAAGAVAAALVTGWTPAPALNDVAVAIAAAFTLTPTELAAALLVAAPSATLAQLAAAVVAAVAAITASDLAAALVGAVPASTQNGVAQALVSAIGSIAATATGQALVQAFGDAATIATVAAALAAAAFDLAQTTGALNTIFTPQPGALAAVLTAAFATATATDVLQALLTVYTASVVTPPVGAAALVSAFTARAPLTASAIAIALVAVYTTPVAITAAEVAQALVAALPGAAQRDVAIALVAAFTQPAAIAAGEVAQALVAAFAADATAPSVALALVAAFPALTPPETIAALQTAFTLTVPQQAVSLVAAFPAASGSDVATALVAQNPTLAAGDCVGALVTAFGVTFQASEAAVAIAAAYTGIGAQQVLEALRDGYPGIGAGTAAAALLAPFGTLDETAVATALAAVFSGIDATTVAAALVVAFRTPAVNAVSTALQAAFPSLQMADAVTALVAAFTLTPAAAATALVQTFPATTATMANVAAALLAAIPALVYSDIVTALLVAFSGATGATIAAALVAAFNASVAAIAAALADATPPFGAGAVLAAVMPSVTSDLNIAAAAVAAAFPAYTIGTLASVLIAGVPAATPNEIASALVAAYPSTTIATLVPALVSGYAAAQGVLFNATVAALAVKDALGTPDESATSLATALGNAYQLTRVPNDVGALSVPLYMAGIGIVHAASALSSFYGSAWNGAAYATLLSIYDSPEWPLAIEANLTGVSTAEVAAQIIQQLPGLSAPRMVLAIASSYYLTYVTTAGAVQQVAQAMLAATYTLTNASSAMSLFYAPNWGAAEYTILLQVYDGGQ
ncbi:MAG TPA: hypothetical protein VF824_15880 [Thermoanaerobaculia bacterium]